MFFSRPPPAPIHTTSKSLSVVTMSDASDQYLSTTHRAAKSCDLDAESNRHLEVGFTPEGQPFYIESVFCYQCSNILC